MKPRIAYKVVFKHPYTGLCTSANRNEIPDELVLTYKIGEITLPKIGRIFVFDTLEHAYDFMRKFVGDTIFEGIVTDIGVPRIISPLDVFGVEDFWKIKRLHRRNIFHKEPPTGTRSCSSFTPTKIVV